MPDPVVATRYGRLRGREEEGLVVFRGVRYAQPPVASLRLRPPAAPERSAALVDAGEFGPIAPQPGAGPGSYVPGDPTEQDEDCLSLNVWTPACDDVGRPVMVFVHGGAFLTGGGSSVMYRGELLARRGVVVVTFNYRLGVLGFLAHPLLMDARSGGYANWGLMDQIAALGWVRDHIAAFGGDPANVTIFGESAGAMSIADLLGTSAARGLFRRAILQSGACTALPRDPAVAMAERFAATLGIDEPSRDQLRGVPPADLVAAQVPITASVDQGMGMPFRPVVDGGLLPRHPADEIADGLSSGVDLLIGTNRDEFKFFAFAGADVGQLDDLDVEAIVSRYLAGAGLGESVPKAADVLDTYRAARRDRGDRTTPFDLLCAVAGDWIFRVPAVRLADAHAVHSTATYTYLFDWESPFAGGALGACHGLELPFVFGTVRNPVIALFSGGDAEAIALSDAIQGAWVAFASTGDPSSIDIGPWPRYEARRRATMTLGPHIRPVDAPYEAERRFWEEHLGRYGKGGPIEGAVPIGVALLVASEPEGVDDEQRGT
ncbi:MAG: Carboxylesterase type [Acidimicrobiaceae bacterium]|nr:Carboxylesterase type [Acidimicrobiaceae bacterium]